MNKSTRHIFETLSLICKARRPVSLTEVRKALELPTSTAHRALVTLEEAGYIARYRCQFRYLGGLLPRHLTQALFKRFAYRHVFQPHLNRLATETKLTVSLTSRIGWYGMTTMVIEGSRDVHRLSTLGQANLLHEDGGGQIILAHLPDSEIARMQAFVDSRWPGLGRDVARFATSGVIRDARKQKRLLKPLKAGAGKGVLHLPVTDDVGRGIAAVSVGSAADPIDRSELREILLKAKASLAAAAQELKANPTFAVSPFAHLPVDEITFPVRRSRPRDAGIATAA